MQLFELIETAPCHDPEKVSYGVDIDEANEKLFSTNDKTEKRELLFNWAKKSQPCIIGRLGSAKKRGIQISVFIVDEQDVAQGDAYLQRYLRQCRRTWKDQCRCGKSDAALYF
jgi:hypothetical protein